MIKRTASRPVKLLQRVLLALAMVIAAYLLAGLVGSLIPANAGWREPAAGVRIFIRTNGVHTWVMTPTVTPEIDWRAIAPAAHIRDPRRAGAYMAFGYGNREFYLNTPRWRDLRLSTAFSAMLGGGPTLMHVDHEPTPAFDADTRPIVLDRVQYRRLAAFIRASFARDAQGRTQPLLGRGYDQTDMFYEAIGPYSALVTCNEWTGRALRAAGVRTGAWTPAAQSIMSRLPSPPAVSKREDR